EIWFSDGTAAGTFLTGDIRPGRTSSSPADFYFAPDTRALIFTADDGVHGREPWAAFGVVGSAASLGDIRPGRLGSQPRDFIELPDGGADRILFTADDGKHGRELWGAESDPFSID